MKHLLLSIILLPLVANSSSAQWSNIYFPDPTAFGTHDSSFFAFRNYDSRKGLFKLEPIRVEADTGINPAYFPIVGIGSIGPYVLVDAGYRSTNNGSNWTPMHPFTFVPSCFATMGGLIFAGGIAGSGVWRSTDSGLDWVAAYSGLGSLNVGSLSVIDTILFAGTTSGVFRSTDSGRSWQATSFTERVNALVVLGANIFVATYGKNFGTDAGVYCSSDNGAHWKQDTIGLFNRIVSVLVSNGRYLFAGTGALGGSGQYSFGDGVFMSTDSGKTWDTINYGLTNYEGTNFYGINALGIFDTLIFAGAWGSDNKTFVRSIPEILHQKGDTQKGAVSEPPVASDSIMVYPNPTTASVSILAGGTSILGVSVLNVLGEAVLTVPTRRESEVTLDLSKLPSGTYFLEIETGEGTVLRKVIRE